MKNSGLFGPRLGSLFFRLKRQMVEAKGLVFCSHLDQLTLMVIWN